MTEHEQLGTLLYINVEYTIVTTVRSNLEISSYMEVRAAFNSFFAVRRNTIVEQALEESVDTFIQNLYLVAKDCEYGTLQDLLINVISRAPVVIQEQADELFAE